MEQLLKTIELAPSFAPAHFDLAFNYWQMGKYEQWLAEWQKGATLAGDANELEVAKAAARAYASSGYKGAVRKIIEVRREQSKRIYVPAISFAINYAALGEKDQAFFWLDKAYEERGRGLELVKIIPEFDGLRSDPRYAALLKRMGLPP